MMASTFYDVHLGIIATAIVLLCTLILLPIERFSEKHPSIFTKHIFLDPYIIWVGLVLFLTFLYNSLARLPEIFIWRWVPLSEKISTVLSIVSIVCIVIGVARIAHLFDPKILLNKVLKGAYKFISAEKKWINSCPQDPSSKIQEINEMMQDTLNTGESADPKKIKYRVPYKLVGETLRAISIFKDAVTQYGSNKITQGYTAALDCLSQLVEKYYMARSDYVEWRDGVTVRIIEITTDLRNVSRDASDIIYERACITTIENFGKASMKSKFIGSNQGYHTVGQSMLKTLLQHSQESVTLKRQDGAYEALTSAERLSIIMCNRTYIKSVSIELESMLFTLKIALVSQDYVVAQAAISCIFRSIFAIVGNNQPHTSYDRPISKAEKALKEILKLEIYGYQSLYQTQAVMWNAEIQQDFSWNALARNALFSNHVHEKMLIYNTQFVETVVKLLMNLIGRFDQIFPDHLYQVGLWLISGLSPDFAMKMLISNQATVFHADEKEKIREIFKEIINFWVTKKDLVASKDVLSLISILIILEEITSNSEKKLAEECVKLLCENVNKYKTSFDATQQYNIIRMEKLLRDRGFEQYAKSISIGPLRSYSFYDLDLFEIIKRPLVTFDSTYFSKMDESMNRAVSSGQ